MLCVYSNDTYMAKLYSDPCAVDDTVLKSRATLCRLHYYSALIEPEHQRQMRKRGDTIGRERTGLSRRRHSLLECALVV
jgi:hypothetical protein